MTSTDAGTLYRSGWYPDPVGRFEFRFHNGLAWTADVATSGTRYVDPLGLGSPGGESSAGGQAGNGLAITAMILGIVGVTIAWLPFIFVVGTICALLAIILGIVAVRRSAHSGRGFAVTGIVTGLAGLFLTAVGVALSVAVVDAVDAFNNPVDHEVRLTDCTLTASRARAIGEITNTGDEPAEFVITIAFVRPGTNNPHRTSSTSVDDVAPGDSATFEVSRQVALDDIGCEIVDVTGPLPFGIDPTP